MVHNLNALTAIMFGKQGDVWLTLLCICNPVLQRALCCGIVASSLLWYMASLGLVTTLLGCMGDL